MNYFIIGFKFKKLIFYLINQNFAKSFWIINNIIILIMFIYLVRQLY